MNSYCRVAGLFLPLALLTLVGSILTADDADDLARARQAIERGDGRQAVELLDAVIARDAKAAEAYYWRGREQFKLGKVKESVADFDRYVELRPNAESSQWERGIAYYYVGDYDKGAKQFELYQTYHDQDVENSAWRYLCVAKTEGVDKARENMLPISRDPRVPMMEIYELFRGKKTPDDVFAAAKAGEPAAAALKTRLFYAHLYVGLYFDSLGKTEEAREHILAAAEKYRIGHYMGDVAVIHARQFAAAEKEKEE
jgi:lipoprotein NlpI